MTTTDDSSDAAPEWTRDEDRIICVRKSEAKSCVYNILCRFHFPFLTDTASVRSMTDSSNHHARWAEIGKELKRSRRECQQRHRALSSHAKELGITTAKLAELYVDEDNERSKTKKSSKYRDEGRPRDSSEAKTEKSKAKHKSKSKPEAPPESKKKKNKKGASETSSDSGSDPKPDSSSDNDFDNLEAEYWAQRRYIYDTQYGELYPDQKVLRADRFYSESDCRVLAGLEARYRANKWLYIQADFCNATGRMVQAEILKAKFYEDQDGEPSGSALNE
ncbi:hypothetical protein F4801DRAFT_294248 [Xylaria longipes]|nr:hypothetical protein F4801DRAFT_294248 [Xylaria longipes]